VACRAVRQCIDLHQNEIVIACRACVFLVADESTGADLLFSCDHSNKSFFNQSGRCVRRAECERETRCTLISDRSPLVRQMTRLGRVHRFVVSCDGHVDAASHWLSRSFASHLKAREHLCLSYSRHEFDSFHCVFLFSTPTCQSLRNLVHKGFYSAYTSNHLHRSKTTAAAHEGLPYYLITSLGLFLSDVFLLSRVSRLRRLSALSLFLSCLVD
jgi:hypothetical protein